MLRFIVSSILFFHSVVFADLLILHNSISQSYNPTSLIEAKKIEAIAQKEGIKVTFKGYPWKRALLMIEQGLADGLINASYNKQRAKYALYPMQTGELDLSKRLNDGESYYIFKHKDASIKWDGEKFTQVDGPVGAKDGYAVVSNLKEHKNIKIVLKTRQEQLFSDLVKGKIVAYATMTKTIEGLLEANKAFNNLIIKEPQSIRQKPYFLIFSKKTYMQKKEQMEKIWSGLKVYNE